MRRKKVLRRIVSIAEVRASLHTHRKRVGRKVDERPASADADPFSQAYFDHMDQELATVERDVIKAEDAHVRKLVLIVQARRNTEEVASDLYGKQTSARQVLGGLYGSDRELELAAVSGRTPQAARALAEQVDQTVKMLRNPQGNEPPRKVAGVSVDFDVMADDLEGGRKVLRRSRAGLERARKAADGTRILTDEAIAEYDRVFPWVASSLEGLFRLAGEHDLADRIRTSVRRVTRKRDEKDDAEAEEATAVESAAEETTEGPPPAETSESAEAPSPAGP